MPGCGDWMKNFLTAPRPVSAHCHTGSVRLESLQQGQGHQYVLHEGVDPFFGFKSHQMQAEMEDRCPVALMQG